MRIAQHRKFKITMADSFIFAIKKLGAVLARHRGEEEQKEVRHLFQRLSLLLMRGNASLLVNRVPGEDEVDADVDGVE